MHKGFIHLLEFETEAEADNAYDWLHYIEREADAGNYEDDMSYQFSVQDAFDTAKNYIEEIDWRNAIDKNNVYDYGDGKLQIVNDVAVDLYI